MRETSTFTARQSYCGRPKKRGRGNHEPLDGEMKGTKEVKYRSLSVLNEQDPHEVIETGEALSSRHEHVSKTQSMRW